MFSVAHLKFTPLCRGANNEHAGSRVGGIGVLAVLLLLSQDRKNGKTLITGIGSYFYPEPRGVTDTPGYSAAVSGIGGAK